MRPGRIMLTTVSIAILAPLVAISGPAPTAVATPRPSLLTARVQNSGIVVQEPRHPGTYGELYADPQAEFPSWNGDGTELAVSTPYAANGGQTSEIKIINRAGRVIEQAFKNTYIRGASISPNGTMVAYGCYAKPLGGGPQPLELCVGDLTTGKKHMITDPKGEDSLELSYMGLSWSPDETQIAFNDYHAPPCPGGAGDTSCTYDAVGIADVDSGDVSLLKGGYEGLSPDWSPDGDSIAFFRGAQWSSVAITGLIVVPAPGKKGSPRTVVDTDHAGGYSGESYVAWSADGKLLAFTSNKGDANGGANHNDIYTVDASDGSDQTNQTNSYANEDEIDWAPPAPGCTIEGTPKADKITGTKHGDVICGEGGNDVIKGVGGNDRILGGAGNDKLYGGSGSDTILGEDGNDTLSGSSGSDTLQGGDGNDLITGGRGKDILEGGAGADTLHAKDGVPHEKVAGGGGSDHCTADKHDHKTGC